MDTAKLFVVQYRFSIDSNYLMLINNWFRDALSSLFYTPNSLKDYICTSEKTFCVAEEKAPL